MSVSTSVHLYEGAEIKGRTLTTGEAYLEIANGKDRVVLHFPEDEREAADLLAAIGAEAAKLRTLLLLSRSHNLS